MKNPIMQQIEELEAEEREIDARIRVFDNEKAVLVARKAVIEPSIVALRKVYEDLASAPQVIRSQIVDEPKQKAEEAPVPATKTSPKPGFSEGDQKKLHGEKVPPRQKGTWNRMVITDVLVKQPMGRMEVNALWEAIQESEPYYADYTSFKTSINSYSWLRCVGSMIELLKREDGTKYVPEEPDEPIDDEDHLICDEDHLIDDDDEELFSYQIEVIDEPICDDDEELFSHQIEALEAPKDTKPLSDLRHVSTEEVLDKIAEIVGSAKNGIPENRVRKMLRNEGIKISSHELKQILANNNNGRGNHGLHFHRKCVKLG